MAASSVNSDHDGLSSPVVFHNEETKPKKIKISAGNGWDTLALWNGNFSDPKLTTSTAAKRPRTSKVKLTELPSLPLDLLYEVCGNTPIKLP
jgi:hypothetical protein